MTDRCGWKNRRYQTTFDSLLLAAACLLLAFGCSAVADRSSADTSSGAPSTTVDKPESRCDGHTIEFENCVFGVYKYLEAERLELVDKLQHKLVDEDAVAVAGGRTLTAELASAAESAFVEYRQQTCESVYQQFIEGTARGALAQACNIRLTRDHNSVLKQRLYGQGFGT